MLKVFLDANIFFSGINSSTGASALLLRLAIKRKIKIYSIDHVIAEAERNIRNKLTLKELLIFYNVLSKIDIQLTPIYNNDADRYLDIIYPKDAIILAGAVISNADFLITLDKKHFFTPLIKQANLNIVILTPGTFLQQYF